MTVRHILVAALALTQVAWTQYFTSTGAPVRWSRAEVVVLMDSAGTADVPGDLEFDAISRSIDTWNAVTCPHPLLKDGGRVTGAKPGAGTDKNLLIWWADQADWSTPGMDHVIALTTLYYDDRSGIAAKFDMEFADFAYEFTVTDQPAMAKTDVENTVTHELGHVLGLDHSKDPDATMYYSAPRGDMSKRTLAQDDITGLCAIYSLWTEPDPASLVEGGLVVKETDVPASGGGCRTAATPSPVSGFILLGSAMLLLGLGLRGRYIRRGSWFFVALLVLIGPGWAHLATEEGRPLRWNADYAVFSFDESRGTDDIPDAIEWDIIKTAMSIWNEVPCAQPQLVATAKPKTTPGYSDTSDGIFFGRAEVEDPSVIAYTTNTYVAATGEITASSIVFNDKFSFTFLSASVDVDLGSIAVHELGHALGLGHSGRFKATMYPYYYLGTTFNRDLQEDDASGLCNLYGGSLPDGWTSSWPWVDPPSQNQCEDGCEAVPTGLPALQATWPKYEISGRSGCVSESGSAGGGALAGLGAASLLILSSRIRPRRPVV